MSFSVPIKKEVLEASNDDDDKKVRMHSLRFIDTMKHLDTGLSTLVDNLSELNKCDCKDPTKKIYYIELEKRAVKIYMSYVQGM